MTDIQITGFDLMHKLGEGGMATVWQARQVSLDRIVAIKILSSKFASDPDDIQRFQQEAQSAAKLKHPGIVQVYDANIENGVYFIVMEFVDGYTCEDWLKRKGALSEKDVLLIADCVSDSLRYAWERQNIIHCDIKPDNVMVDEDGTVKVTDLGLSRTINAMNVAEETDEILGTPAYMAPEQAMGEAGQDCRLDMYALGAMMYHLSTGKLLFEGSSVLEVMERQVNDTVENPKDLNPALSRGFCRLVEVLMAKDKAGRPEDWSQVRDAIKRVKKGHIPWRSLPEGIQSTVRNSAADEAASHALQSHTAAARSTVTSKAGSKNNPLGLILAGVVSLIVIVVIAATLIEPPKSRPPAGGVRRQPSGAPAIPSESRVAEQKGRTLYLAAANRKKSSSASYTQAITMYRRVVSEAPDTRYAANAIKDIARLEAARKKNAQVSIMVGLNRRAAQLMGQNAFDKAIRVYANYTGTAASDLQSQRDAKISKIREQKRAWMASEKRRADAERASAYAERASEYASLIDKVVDLVLKADFRNAKNAVETVSIAGSLPDHANDLRNLASVLSEAADMDTRIEDSFRNQVGTKVSVRLVSGTRTLVIRDVKDGVVRGGETIRVGAASATMARDFKLADLSFAERLGRMGRDDDPPVALVKGVMAYCSQSLSHAKRYFGAAPNSISQKLLDKLDSAIASAPSSPSPVEVADVPPVVEPVQPVPMNPPPDAPPAAADNIDGFINKFITENPGLDSERIQIKEGRSGEVISVTVIRAPELSDLSALASLKSLQEFNYVGHRYHVARIRDLTPLAELPLVSLRMSSTKVVSVEPIKSMVRLKHLSMTQCPLKDISPLRDLKLESIDLSGTKVFDFSNIKRMPLKSFAANSTSLKNVSFLRGMNLESVSLADTPVYDFSVFARMPINELNVSETQFKYLESLKNLPLETLRANDSNITDLTALKYFAKTLKVLDLNSVKATKFDTLEDLDLSHLSLQDTQFSNTALLRDMELVYLNLNRTKVDLIDALNPVAMTVLSIEDTGVESIVKLEGCKLKRFFCKGAPIRNFRPIYGAPIRYMSISSPEEKQQLFGELSKLTIVNGQNIHDNPLWN